MILVPHYIGSSAIAGVGLFTTVSISAGETVYRFSYRFVQIITDAEVRAMPAASRERIANYSYRGKGRDRLQGAMYYCADDSRFMNHSNQPNTCWLEDSETYIATRDIPADTELTCDYADFCEPGDLCFSF